MDKRLKIVQLMTTTALAAGAIEKQTLALCAELAKKNEVHLLADKSHNLQCAKHVSFHAVDFNQGLLNPWLYWQLARLLYDIQPDIIHAHSTKAVSLLHRLSWVFRQPVYVATIYQPLEKLAAYEAMDGLISGSLHLAETVSSKKIRVIYNALASIPRVSVREKKQLKASLLAGSELPLLLVSCPLIPSQAIDLLLQAFVGVAARLVIIGDGLERANLEQLCQQLGLAEQVLFLGTRNDSAVLLQAADLCVVAAHYQSSSLFLLQALAVGCPVIATNVGDAKEWLPEALLVAPNNVKALHSVLCDTLKRLHLLRRNYLPIFLRAQHELTITGMAESTQAFYDDLLEQHP